MGAMSRLLLVAPTQQMAEALAGIALAHDLARDARDLRLVPLEHGHAIRVSELRHASPRSAFCTGQIARHFGLLAERRRALHIEPDGGRPGRLRGDDDDAP
jgi:hypothetical protein